MSFVAAGAAIVSAGVAIAKMVQGKKQADQARLDEQKAKQEMDKQKDAFASMDTTNPYLNMENTMEDLTVNKQQAEFQQQQQMQQQANIMQPLSFWRAGGSVRDAIGRPSWRPGPPLPRPLDPGRAEQNRPSIPNGAPELFQELSTIL